jgi:hypothetical protein
VVDDGKLEAPIAHRYIQINKADSTDLQITADFDKTSYYPGETVNQKIKVRNSDGT